jgi:hypothetical protein
VVAAHATAPDADQLRRPSREDCIAQRTRANTPQQALTLLNDPTFVEAARVWAGRLMAIQGDDAQRIEGLSQQALAARSAAGGERGIARHAEPRLEVNSRQAPPKPPSCSKSASAAAASGDPNDLGAWTTVCRVILNLHETITRY